MNGLTAVCGCLACGGELEPVKLSLMGNDLGRAELICPACNVVNVIVLTMTLSTAHRG